MKESTAAYEKTLVKMAKDHTLKMLSKDDKKKLVKIAQLLKHANESVDGSVNEAPDHDMFRALNKVNNDVFKIMNKYDGKADMDAVFRSWMLGLHAKLKKAGVKL